MTSAVSNKTHVYAADGVLPRTLQDTAVSGLAQRAIGFGLGLGIHQIYGPLTEKVVNALGSGSVLLSDPFGGLGLYSKIFLMPFVCIVGPIMEEEMFRGDLQEALKNAFEPFFSGLGFDKSTANLAARVTAVFFSAIVFGLLHFTNALVFWCNPILFLPQVVAATIMGLIFGLAKEAAGSLHLPIGMHIGNNTLAWASVIAS